MSQLEILPFYNQGLFSNNYLEHHLPQTTIDLSCRNNLELLEEHFKESTSKLAPLKARIKVADDLIDEIVYRLYGVAEDERRIVEEK